MTGRDRAADVVVVGAGPAGSLTAMLLARDGHDVLIIDRAAFPRPKPCGDCLSAAAVGLLHRVGLLDRVLSAGAAEIERWDIVAPGGVVATGRFPDRPALAVERERLDAALLDAAVAAGARFHRARVSGLHRDSDGRVRGVVADGQTLTARLVVGADGLRSVVARALHAIRRPPRLRKLSLTTHLTAPDVATGAPDSLRHGEMHILAGGCIGVAPVGQDRINMTLVVDGTHGDALRAQGPDRFFRTWVRRAPAVRERLDGHPTGPFLASGPFDWPVRSPVIDGAALVGDAAGYFDPFTGQGIYQAMAGAELLAGAVAPELEAGADALDRGLREYRTAKARLTRPVRRLQRAVEAVVSRPWLADHVIGRLAVATPAMDRLIEVTGDLRGPRSLISPGVASSLLFPPDPEHV